MPLFTRNLLCRVGNHHGNALMSYALCFLTEPEETDQNRAQPHAYVSSDYLLFWPLELA